MPSTYQGCDAKQYVVVAGTGGGDAGAPVPLGEVFAFFSDAHNLEDLDASVAPLSRPQPVRHRHPENTELNYRLRVHGLSLSWTTEIRIWDPPHPFVDLQRKGPYRLWHHTHRFEPSNGGTKMTDVVRYRLPFGVLGRLVRATFVDRDVEKIFNYRYEKIAPCSARQSDADITPEQHIVISTKFARLSKTQSQQSKKSFVIRTHLKTQHLTKKIP